MLVRERKWWIRACCAFAWLLLGGCRSAEETEKPQIVASLFPLYEFATAVGADMAEANLLLPPGVEPHAWEPKASDLVAISRSDLFLCVSESLEPWVTDVVKGGGHEGLRVLAAAEGLEEKAQEAGHGHGDDYEEGQDPHVWLDLSHDRTIVKRIARELSSIDPENAARYRSNADVYNEKLQALDEKYEEGLASCRHRTIVLGGHSAFSYLARRYGLKEIPLYGISADSEPTPRRLAEIVEIARDLKVKVVFFDTLVSPRLARVVAEEVGAGMLVLNPGANMTREQFDKGLTFLAILEKNLENLRKGLECEG
jgi:zinc transport system substrate-binding protein